jgi:hypothetical protein
VRVWFHIIPECITYVFFFSLVMFYQYGQHGIIQSCIHIWHGNLEAEGKNCRDNLIYIWISICFFYIERTFKVCRSISSMPIKTICITNLLPLFQYNETISVNLVHEMYRINAEIHVTSLIHIAYPLVWIILDIAKDIRKTPSFE